MYRFIMDAETDGLYGKILTIAVLVAKNSGEVVEYFYGGIPNNITNVSNVWVKENVIPILGEYEVFEEETEILNKVWHLWEKYQEKARCFVDILYPVESHLLWRMVKLELNTREYLGPFPIIDIAGLLLAMGKDPNTDRQALLGETSGMLHNALFDVQLSNRLLSYMRERGMDV